MKEVVVFDLGGVLIHLNVERCIHTFETLMGEENMRAVLGMDSHGEGITAVSIANKQLMADFERGMISSDDFLKEVLSYCYAGTTKEQVIDAWMSMLGDLPAERLAFVDTLREKGHSVYLLSNGNDLHFNFINQTYGLEQHFDGLFLSQRMHMAKPERAIFEAVEQYITAQHSAVMVLFIDDIEANRRAAEEYVSWRTFKSIEDFSDTYKL